MDINFDVGTAPIDVGPEIPVGKSTLGGEDFEQVFAGLSGFDGRGLIDDEFDLFREGVIHFVRRVGGARNQPYDEKNETEELFHDLFVIGPPFQGLEQ